MKTRLVQVKSTSLRFLRWSEKYTKTDMVFLVSGGSWLFFEQAAGAVFALVLAFVFGHYASQDTYGNYKYALSLAAVLSAFSLTGFSTAITQATSRGHEGSLAQGFGINLRWSVPMVLIGFAAAIYYYVQGNTFLTIALAIIAVTSPFLNGFALFDSFLIGRREFKRTAIYTVITNALPVIAVIIALFFLGKRAIYLVITYLIVSTAINAFFYLKSVRSAKNTIEDPQLFRYGFHLSLMGVLGVIADKIDSIAVFTVLGPAQLAVYTYAIAIPDQVKGVVKNIAPLSIAKFSEQSIQNIKETIWRRTIILFISIALCVGVYIVLAPLIFHLLFPIYSNAIVYTQIYALSLLGTFATPFVAVLQSHRKTKELYINSIVSSLVIIISFPVLTYYYGIWGSIISQMIYRLSSTLLVIWQFSILTE